jgi:hypothetical protein
MIISAPLLAPRTQTSLEKRRGWLSHVADAEVSHLALAVAVLLVDLEGAQFGVVRPNPRRLAGELKESLPAAVRALGELVNHGYLRALPKRAAGGGYRLVVPDNVDAGRTDSPSRGAVSCSTVEHGRRWACDIALHMVTLPSAEADAHMQRVLSKVREEMRVRRAAEGEIEREIGKLRSVIWAAYWCAVLTPGGAQ